MKCDSKATKNKKPCGYDIAKCPYASHAADSAAPERHGAVLIGTASQPAQHDEVADVPTRAVPEAVGGRDLRQLAWWTAGALIDGSMEARDVSAMCTLIRTLQALGPEPGDRETILREVELRGVVMNGFPPRDEDEWALAARVFDAEAIAEFHRWDETGHGW